MTNNLMTIFTLIFHFLHIKENTHLLKILGNYNAVSVEYQNMNNHGLQSAMYWYLKENTELECNLIISNDETFYKPHIPPFTGSFHFLSA